MSQVQAMKVTIYVRPGCAQCDATERALDRAGVRYRIVDVSRPENAEVRLSITARGFRSAPVVVVEGAGGDEVWSGFRPDRIRGLLAREGEPERARGALATGGRSRGEGVAARARGGRVR